MYILFIGKYDVYIILFRKRYGIINIYSNYLQVICALFSFSSVRALAS